MAVSKVGASAMNMESLSYSPRESPLQCGGASVGSRIPKVAHIAQHTPQGHSMPYFVWGWVAN